MKVYSVWIDMPHKFIHKTSILALLLLLIFSPLLAQKSEQIASRKIKFRAGVSGSYFRYDHGFFAPLKDLRPGINLGLILGKKWSEHMSSTIEPNLELQRLANVYNWQGNETKTRVELFNMGIDFLPFTYKLKTSPWSFGFGAFGKYSFHTTLRSSLNGSPVMDPAIVINNFQSGSILMTNYHFKSTKISFRYQCSFGQLLNLNQVQTGTNSFNLVFVW